MSLTQAALTALFLQCAPDVSPVTLNALVGVESDGNPYVVANVTDGTSHRFDSKQLAIDFLNKLSSEGKTYSAGLMQIYSGNFKGYSINNESVFDNCKNIKTGSLILKDCFLRAVSESNDVQEAIRKAFSCYYSNNFTRGFKKEKDGKSYVQRIELKAEKQNMVVPAIQLNEKNKNAEVDKTNEHLNKEAVIGVKNKESSDSWDIFGDF